MDDPLSPSVSYVLYCVVLPQAQALGRALGSVLTHSDRWIVLYYLLSSIRYTRTGAHLGHIYFIFQHSLKHSLRQTCYILCCPVQAFSTAAGSLLFRLKQRPQLRIINSTNYKSSFQNCSFQENRKILKMFTEYFSFSSWCRILHYPVFKFLCFSGRHFWSKFLFISQLTVPILKYFSYMLKYTEMNRKRLKQKS